jgi:LacI family transcriptional regulator
MQRRVTIKDVAMKARVSHPTVSRVINDSPRISAATKARVRAAMEALGYRPNLIARSLVRSRTRTLALVTPDLNPHVVPIVRGVADVCRHRDLALMLFSTDYWAKEDVATMWITDNWRVDGVLVYNVFHQDQVSADLRRLQDGDLPICFLNKYLHRRDTWAVGVDNDNAVAQAVQHLASLGRRRIGVINGNLRSVDGVERQAAFKRALALNGLSFDPHLEGTANFGDVLAYEEMKRILTRRRKPDALFCANDMMATGAITALLEAGLRVPEDVAVVGVDDDPCAMHFNPALTTLKMPLRQVGEQAVDLLMERLERKQSRPRQSRLRAELILRASTIGKAAPRHTP